MPLYTKSSGEQIETTDMPYKYLLNAFNKATENGDEENIKVLQDEINIRDNTTDDSTDVAEEDESAPVDDENTSFQ